MIHQKKRIVGQKMVKMNPSKGINYKSQFEKDFGQDLLRLKKGGVVSDWTYEEDYITYKLEHKYNPDFKLVGKYGRVMYIETKGYFKSKDRTKHKKVKAQNPEYDVRFVFMNSRTRLNKNSKTTYGSWCTKNGFQYADRRVPNEWLRELNKE
jgi:hypothetical protein